MPLAPLGRGILRAAPWLMKGLSVAGTAAMFLVGGGILVHGVPALHHCDRSRASNGAGGVLVQRARDGRQRGLGIAAGAWCWPWSRSARSCRARRCRSMRLRALAAALLLACGASAHAVDVNSANRAQLEQVRHVGPPLAEPSWLARDRTVRSRTGPT